MMMGGEHYVRLDCARCGAARLWPVGAAVPPCAQCARACVRCGDARVHAPVRGLCTYCRAHPCAAVHPSVLCAPCTSAERARNAALRLCVNCQTRAWALVDTRRYAAARHILEARPLPVSQRSRVEEKK